MTKLPEKESDNDLGETYSDAYKHQCEILSVVRMYREKGGDFVKSFLLKVEKARGSQSAERLRNDALNMINRRIK